MNVAELIRNAAERKTRFAFELLPPLKGEGLGPVFGAIDPRHFHPLRWKQAD